MHSKILIPDLGGSSATVIELLVKPGDTIEVDTPLVTLEGDKASMDIPATSGGVVKDINIAVGDTVNEGDVLLHFVEQSLDSSNASSQEETESVSVLSSQPSDEIDTDQSLAEQSIVKIPDIGSDSAVVIEVMVKAGDVITVDQPLITVEGDKASMDIPSPFDGEVVEVFVHVQDKVSTDDHLLSLLTVAKSKPVSITSSDGVIHTQDQVQVPVSNDSNIITEQVDLSYQSSRVYAGPLVRKIAREFGVDLARVKGSGRRGRITKQDVQSYVKAVLSGSSQVASPKPSAFVDPSRFGNVTDHKFNKIKLLTGKRLTENWQTIPHVTQYDYADITDAEACRKILSLELSKEYGIKISPLFFICRAVISALKSFPYFNAQLNADQSGLLIKDYVHLGIAVDTDAGLVVPVIKNADKLTGIELIKEINRYVALARESKLKPSDMQGGCMTISSLGSVGGEFFTPIINAPELAILGVSKARQQLVFNKDKQDFLSRLMCPLSLSYDHRAIDGVQGMQFLAHIMQVLASFNDVSTVEHLHQPIKE